jgi:hypothetical protein
MMSLRYISIIVWATIITGASTTMALAGAQSTSETISAPPWVEGGAVRSLPNPGDGIFTPRLSTVAAIDKTDRPFTVDVMQPEPRFAELMVAGKPTGSSYIIKFPTGDVGGDCTYDGKGRYFIESTGTLTFQIITECGKLKRGYNFMVCMLNEELRCREVPWWYFRERTYAITNQGLVVNGSTVYPWKEGDQAQAKLEKVSSKLKAMKARFMNPNDPHVVHSRFITCRFYHPETKSYELHELTTACVIKSICNAVPSVDALRDGDPIDWNSPVGGYVIAKNKIADVSKWACWARSQ